MNPTFLKKQGFFLFQIVFLTIVLYGAHSYILYYFASEKTFFFPLWHIYAFQIMVTFLIYSFLNYKISHGTKQIFNLFMLGTFVKMILSILFLLPLLLMKEIEKQPDVFNFFLAYFFFLFFEVYSLTKILQENE